MTMWSSHSTVNYIPFQVFFLDRSDRSRKLVIKDYFDSKNCTVLSFYLYYDATFLASLIFSAECSLNGHSKIKLTSFWILTCLNSQKLVKLMIKAKKRCLNFKYCSVLKRKGTISLKSIPSLNVLCTCGRLHHWRQDLQCQNKASIFKFAFLFRVIKLRTSQHITPQYTDEINPNQNRALHTKLTAQLH